MGNLQLIVALLVVILCAKVIILGVLVKMSGYTMETAMHAAIGLAQIGEFAFVLAARGKSFGIVNDSIHTLLLHLTVVSLVATPLLIWGSGWLGSSLWWKDSR